MYFVCASIGVNLCLPYVHSSVVLLFVCCGQDLVLMLSKIQSRLPGLELGQTRYLPSACLPKLWSYWCSSHSFRIILRGFCCWVGLEVRSAIYPRPSVCVIFLSTQDNSHLWVVESFSTDSCQVEQVRWGNAHKNMGGWHQISARFSLVCLQNEK